MVGVQVGYDHRAKTLHGQRVEKIDRLIGSTVRAVDQYRLAAV
jgi:hypothetical protein